MPIKLRFAINNRKYWKNLKTSEIKIKHSYVLVEVSKNIFICFGVAALATIVASAKNSKILFYGDRPPKWIKNILISFPNSEFKFKNNTFPNSVYQETKELLAKLNTPSDILNMEYKNLYIGDLVYDLALREGVWQASVWQIDDRVGRVIMKCITIINELEDINKKYNISSAVYSHVIGLPGLILRFFIKRKIECFAGAVGIGPIRRYKNLSPKTVGYIGLMSNNLIEEIINTEKLKIEFLEKAKKYILLRKNAELKDLDSARAFSGNKRIFYDKFEFCEEYKLDSNKPMVFIMLHAFNDFPHHFDKNIFIDYYHWFIETLKIAKKNNHINWIFKEHPSSKFYPDDANLSGIFEITDSANILFLDMHESFNSISIIHLAHAIVTCVGTAGLEFACNGIPCVLGGENHYSSFGIAKIPKNIKEYEKSLASIKKITPLSEDQINKAKIIFYIQYAHISGSTNNNNAFFGNISQEERLNFDIEKVLSDLIIEFENIENQVFLNQLTLFIKDEKRDLFFKDPILWKLDKSSSSIV